MGSRVMSLRKATDRMEQSGIHILNRSDFFETAPWGNTDQSPFINQAIEIATKLSPLDLLHLLKTTEVEAGRRENVRWGPRHIDIDILLFGNSILEVTELTIPHPRLKERRFALVPLSQIARDIIYPGTGESIYQWINRCTDTLEVRSYCTADFHHYTLTVLGEVQSVGFRKHVSICAERNGCKGNVRNTSEGTVVVHAEGTADQLKEFIREIKGGSTYSRIERIEKEECEPEFFTTFHII